MPLTSLGALSVTVSGLEKGVSASEQCHSHFRITFTSLAVFPMFKETRSD